MSNHYWVVTTANAFANAEVTGTALSPYRNARTGFNKDPVGKLVYNVLAAESDLQAIVDACNTVAPDSTTVVAQWAYETGSPDKFTHPQIPDELVELMQPHPPATEGGQPIPATPDNPNMGLRYFGDKPMLLAGAFGPEFGPEFE